MDLRSLAQITACVAVQRNVRPGATLAPAPVRCWAGLVPHGSRTRITVLRATSKS
jgi:hypothetical protein